MIHSEVGKPRGILNPKAGAMRWNLSRLAPAGDLAWLIEHFWIVTWDLRGQKPYVAETLPHPSVHVVIEARRAQVIGVMTGKFSRRLTGRGRAFGIKFRPGAFHPLLGSSLWKITDRVLSVRQVFGSAGIELARRIRVQPDERECASLVEAFLRERAPKNDPTVGQIRAIIERMESNRDLVRVDQAVALTRFHKRRLERIFREYVGVSPKWVIQRYRMHEAAEKIAEGTAGDMGDLALRLGYFDQAHFIRDFKAIVGRPPGEYRAASRG